METIQKQNPYDLVDGKSNTPEKTIQEREIPAPETVSSPDETSLELDTSSTLESKKQIPELQKTIPKHGGPGKFMTGLIGIIAKLMGKPDPITGKMPEKKPITPPQTEKTSPESVNLDTIHTQPQSSWNTAKDILTGVEWLLASIGNTLEKTANKIWDKASEKFQQQAPVTSQEHEPIHKPNPENTNQQTTKTQEPLSHTTKTLDNENLTPEKTIQP